MNGEKLMLSSIAWLRERISGMKFGEVTVRIVVHDGEIRRIEKTFSIKEQLQNERNK